METGLPARALKKGLFEIYPVQLRDFADPGRSGRIDDLPYGGGAGMVLQIGPIERALESLPEKLPVVLFTPRGQMFDQPLARELARKKPGTSETSTENDVAGFTLLCGYYEGVDERIAEHLVDYQISIGDYVLGSGDLPALVFIEALTRLIPGYMGSSESLLEESNEDGLLEYPQYTRPAMYKDWAVPDVLLSGNHGEIAKWRKRKSLEITDKRKLRNGYNG